MIKVTDKINSKTKTQSSFTLWRAKLVQLHLDNYDNYDKYECHITLYGEYS